MYKKTTIAAILGFLTPVMAIMGFNAWQDPFHYYHSPEGSDFSENARWQNPGMIRNYDYDSVIVGTSRFENFKPSMFIPYGWKILKATAPGSMANEQLDTVSLVLDQGRAKRIVLEMSHVSYTATARRSGSEFPSFLYRTSPETPFQYLLSFDLFLRAIFPTRRTQSTLEELYVWWPNYKNQFSEQQLIDKLIDRCEQPTEQKGIKPPTEDYLDRLESLIVSNPGVSFIAVFTPLSAIALGVEPASDQLPDPLSDRLEFRLDIADLAKKYENMILYDYATQSELVTELSRYKDPAHFDMATTKLMAQEISSGTAPLANLDDINSTLLRIRQEFDAARFSCDQLTADPHYSIVSSSRKSHEHQPIRVD